MERTEKEIWKPIKDFPDYEVSNLGRIKSYKRVAPWKDPLISDGSISKEGYYRVTLFRQSKPSHFLVHRLVLETFVGPCPLGCQTNHKNGIKIDNRLKNLEWVTFGDNIEHAYRIGLKTNRGIMNSNAKLRNEDVLEIRRLAKKGIKKTIIAEMFKISSENVYTIAYQLSWRHI